MPFVPIAAMLAGLMLSGADAPRVFNVASGLTWINKPVGQDMADAIPEKARRANISGWVILECRFGPLGRFDSCVVIGEGPRDYGFGEGAMQLSRLFKAAPKTKTGELLEGGYVQFPIHLVIGSAARPPYDYRAGEPAMLITAAGADKTSAFPCPTTTAPERQCEAHAFRWEKSPDLRTTAALIRAAEATSGVSTLRCRTGADQELTGCATSEDDGRRRDAMLGLAKMMKPAAAADDGVSIASGVIAIEFHWSALREAVDASALTKP